MARHSFDATRKAGIQKDYTMKEYTPESCVRDLLKLVPIEKGDVCLDPSSGINKVWFNNFPTKNKIEVELDDGTDFLNFNQKVDWVLGNPPFTLFIKFLFHSSEIANKGFGFLINHSRLNQVTPKRLDDLKAKGFHLSKIHIFGVKMWFGRYYFLLFTKKPNDCISFSRINYGNTIAETETQAQSKIGSFNKGLEENSNEFSQISANAETSPNPNIKLNLPSFLVGVEKQNV